MHRTLIGFMAGLLILSAGCTTGPEDVIGHIDTAVASRNVLKFEEAVDLDKLLPNVIAAASGMDADVNAVRKMRSELSDQILQGQMTVVTVVDRIFAMAGIPTALASHSTIQLYYGHGPTNIEGAHSLTELFFRHPFVPTDTVRVYVEMTKASGNWRVVGIRGLEPLIEEWRHLDGGRALGVMRADLMNLAAQEEIYYADHYAYSQNADDIAFLTHDSVTVTIVAAGKEAWGATAEHSLLPSVRCAIWYGFRSRPEVLPTTFGGITPESGAIACDPVHVDTAYMTATGSPQPD